MSKISKEGYEQLTTIRTALDAMYDKLDKVVFIPKGKVTKNVESTFTSTNVFNSVQEEFETIAGIINDSGTWEEV